MHDQPQRTQRTQRGVEASHTYAVIGAAIEVHRTLGSGFQERVYHLALGSEFRRRGIPHESEPTVPVWYKGETLECVYRPDYICFGSVVVELKAVPNLSGLESAQVLNYLKATGLEIGLLLNFGTPVLEKRRLVMSQRHQASALSASSADRRER